jgi:hypothetical protein
MMLFRKNERLTQGKGRGVNRRGGYREKENSANKKGPELCHDHAIFSVVLRLRTENGPENLGNTRHLAPPFPGAAPPIDARPTAGAIVMTEPRRRLPEARRTREKEEDDFKNRATNGSATVYAKELMEGGCGEIPYPAIGGEEQQRLIIKSGWNTLSRRESKGNVKSPF